MAYKCLLVSLVAIIVILSSLNANAQSMDVDLECIGPIGELLATIFPDLEDEYCQKYYQCNNGRLVQLSCSASQRFDPILKVRRYFHVD